MFENVRFDFTGRTVLVAGGSRGIGKGVVQALASAGARVFYTSRNPGDEDLGGVVHFKADLADENDILSLFRRLDQEAELDILVNSAAINFCKPNNEISANEWEQVLSVNLTGAFLLSREALKRMRPRRRGSIIHVSSVAGRHRSIVSGVHYVSSKAGLMGLTRQLAYEAAKDNVRVNAVCPSQTMTDMLRKSMDEKAVERLAQSIPMGRVADVKDQVGPILFLASDAAAYMTGTFLDVNGGIV